jgi:hypothetical protein
MWKISWVDFLASEIPRVELWKKNRIIRILRTGCVMSFQLTDTVITLMCIASTIESLCGVLLGWVQYRKGHDGSNLAQVCKLDKLASEPFLTLCCIGAMKPTAISLHVFFKNLVLLECCSSGLVSLVSSLWVIRQNCDTLRFAQMDSFFCLVVRE